MNSPILAPAAVLILWSLTVMMWMIITRFPAFKNAGVDLANGPAGARYQDVESELPEKVNWKSHNYTHLMEQPTLFYAVVAVLALAGAGSGLNLQLAWAYVGLRIVHSLWQILVNTVPVRVLLFAISSICLIMMAVNAVRLTVLA
ncbi:MAG: MAPEG family protein [Pseudomonadota bacterium]